MIQNPKDVRLLVLDFLALILDLDAQPLHLAGEHSHPVLVVLARPPLVVRLLLRLRNPLPQIVVLHQPTKIPHHPLLTPIRRGRSAS